MKQLFLFLVCTTCSFFLSAQSGFVINPGIHIVKSGSPLLVLNNMNFTNNGNFIPATGTVKLTGTNPIAVKGNNSTDFYNLYAGSSAEVKLEQNIFVQHELKMGGMLQVQSQSINFEPGALIVDESETARLQA